MQGLSTDITVTVAVGRVLPGVLIEVMVPLVDRVVVEEGTTVKLMEVGTVRLQIKAIFRC
jgi:hypothetical protein